jgi:hypothetical protein
VDGNHNAQLRRFAPNCFSFRKSAKLCSLVYLVMGVYAINEKASYVIMQEVRHLERQGRPRALESETLT